MGVAGGDPAGGKDTLRAGGKAGVTLPETGSLEGGIEMVGRAEGARRLTGGCCAGGELGMTVRTEGGVTGAAGAGAAGWFCGS